MPYTKHVFWIHSSITLLVSQKIISNYNIPSTNCVFLLCRDFAISHSQPKKYQNIKHLPIEVFSLTKNIYPCIANIEKLDAKITENIKEKYHIYLPHMLLDFFQLLITHPLCRKISYLEEGMISYSVFNNGRMRLNTKLKFSRLIKYFLYKKRILLNVKAIDYKHAKYNASYAIHSKSFVGIPNRILLQKPFYRSGCKFYADAILVFGTEPDFPQSEQYLEQLKIAYTKLIDYSKRQGCKKIAFKQHPAASAFCKNFFEDILKQYPKELFSSLSSSVILENIFYSYKPMLLMSNSSTGIYAEMCGCKVVSCSQYLSTLKPIYTLFLKNTKRVMDSCIYL